MSLWISAVSLVVPVVGLADIAPKPMGNREPLAVSIAKLGADLSTSLLAEPRNAVYSPYSIATAFGMAREGALGETAAELDRVLHLESLAAPGALSSAFLRLDRAMVRAPKSGAKRQDSLDYRLEVTNGAWVQDGFALESPFRTALESRFRAVARPTDFRAVEDARDEINEWVEEATHGRIEELLAEGLPTPDTVLMLVNAIHLEARWLHEFSKGRTSAAAFTQAPDRIVLVQMMHLTAELEYAETEHAQRVILPYLGGDLEMVVIVPKVGWTLADLTSAEQNKIEGPRKSTGVDLSLPKFDFGRNLDLIPTLKALGMQRAFDLGKAEFGLMSKQHPLAIGAVVHGASIRVDEHGTEASAATAISLLKGEFDGGPDAIEVKVDRPFLFHVRHTRTGVVLFRGRVEDPTRSS